MHDAAINLIYKYLDSNLSLDNIRPSSSRFKEIAFIRWAVNEILMVLYEYSDLIFVPEHISGQHKKGVFEIFDEFVSKMEYFLSLSYIWGFDVAKEAAIQLKRYLINTGLFNEEVVD